MSFLNPNNERMFFQSVEIFFENRIFFEAAKTKLWRQQKKNVALMDLKSFQLKPEKIIFEKNWFPRRRRRGGEG